MLSNPVTHDDAGNLTGDHRGYTYIYDYENRLIRVYVDEDSSGGYNGDDTNIAEFTYDALGRRIEMVAFDNSVSPAASTTTRYYGACPERSRENEQRVLLETDVDGSETDVRYFVYGNYIDEVLVMVDVDSFNPVTDGDYYYAHDHLYSAAALFDNSGSVVERYEYSAYGKAVILDSDFDIRASSLYANAYAFTGRRLDTMDAGSLTIYYYRARTYDPETGRFMQRDPLGVNPSGGSNNPYNPKDQYRDGMNVYQYVKSDTVNKVDPYGLLWDHELFPNLPSSPQSSNNQRKLCCLPSPKIIPSDEEEKKWKLAEDAWIRDLNERRTKEGKPKLGEINGYYRHCVSTCNVSKLSACLGATGTLREALSLIAAMAGGNDWPPIDSNNERYDLLSDAFGMVIAHSPISCESGCGYSMSLYMALVELDIERRGI